MTGSMRLRGAVAASLLFASSIAQASVGGFACTDEGFDDVGRLGARGWIIQNNSAPLGAGTWTQGDPTLFDALDGPVDSYVLVGADSATGVYPLVVSNWLITPQLDFDPQQSIRQFNFYTRAVAGHANRLIIRLCKIAGAEACGAPGPGADDVGGFETVLQDINPGTAIHGYPDQWTWFSPADVSLIAGGRARIAFQYYVAAQPDGSHGTHVGIDSVAVRGVSVCPFTDVVFTNGFD